MIFSDYNRKVLNYFYEHFNKYTTEKEAPADVAGTGYQQEFRNCVYQLFSNKLLEKEDTKITQIHLTDNKYRASKEGKKVILKTKGDGEIKHLILKLLRTDSEQAFELNEVEEAIPIERERIVYLLDELAEAKNITMFGHIEDGDNLFIRIEPKGIGNYFKSEYLKVKESPSTSSNIIHVIGNYSRVYNNSTDNSTNILKENSEVLFQELTKFIRENIEENQKLLELVYIMEENKGKNDFTKSYADFIACAANHVTILSPFIPALTALLPK